MKFHLGKRLGEYVVDEMEEEVSKVVLLDDIANAYNKDRSAFMRMLKKRGIKMQFTLYPISGQRRRCVTPEVAEQIREFMVPDEIVPFEVSQPDGDVEPDPMSY